MIVSVIRKYEIADNIGYFVLDNASSNTTCVTCILDTLEINDITKNRRLCCLGHVINLAAKAFLFGTNPDAFERELKSVDEYNEEVKERAFWRKRGPIGKLHNVAVVRNNEGRNSRRRLKPNSKNSKMN